MKTMERETRSALRIGGGQLYVHSGRITVADIITILFSTSQKLHDCLVVQLQSQVTPITALPISNKDGNPWIIP